MRAALTCRKRRPFRKRDKVCVSEGLGLFAWNAIRSDHRRLPNPACRQGSHKPELEESLPCWLQLSARQGFILVQFTAPCRNKSCRESEKLAGFTLAFDFTFHRESRIDCETFIWVLAGVVIGRYYREQRESADPEQRAAAV